MQNDWRIFPLLTNNSNNDTDINIIVNNNRIINNANKQYNTKIYNYKLYQLYELEITLFI